MLGRVNTGVAQVLQAMQSLVRASAKCIATMMQSVGSLLLATNARVYINIAHTFR